MVILKFPKGVNVNVNSCLSLCVIPATDCAGFTPPIAPCGKPTTTTNGTTGWMNNITAIHWNKLTNENVVKYHLDSNGLISNN